MTKLEQIIYSLFSNNQGLDEKNFNLSIKRVVGFIGFLTILGIAIYCAISKTEAPDLCELIAILSASLLGLDSVTNIWTRRNLPS